MKPQSAKAKGRNLQKYVVQKLLNLSPDLETDDITSRSMGANGEDVLLSPAARKVFPISIECKSIAKFAGYTFLDQAVENAPEGSEPIAVVKANRRNPVVLVDAEYFFDLVRKNNV